MAQCQHCLGPSSLVSAPPTYEPPKQDFQRGQEKEATEGMRVVLDKNGYGDPGKTLPSRSLVPAMAFSRC